jgi:hypothetical protein
VNAETYYKIAVIANHRSYYTMYSLASFIVELQTAKRRLITIFEEPDGPPKDRTRNATNVQRAEIGRMLDAHQTRIAGFSINHDVDLTEAMIG